MFIPVRHPVAHRVKINAWRAFCFAHRANLKIDIMSNKFDTMSKCKWFNVVNFLIYTNLSIYQDS